MFKHKWQAVHYILFPAFCVPNGTFNRKCFWSHSLFNDISIYFIEIWGLQSKQIFLSIRGWKSDHIQIGWICYSVQLEVYEGEANGVAPSVRCSRRWPHSSFLGTVWAQCASILEAGWWRRWQVQAWDVVTHCFPQMLGGPGTKLKLDLGSSCSTFTCMNLLQSILIYSKLS